jgi:hypothetical protein
MYIFYLFFVIIEKVLRTEGMRGRGLEKKNKKENINYFKIKNF